MQWMYVMVIVAAMDIAVIGVVIEFFLIFLFFMAKS